MPPRIGPILIVLVALLHGIVIVGNVISAVYLVGIGVMGRSAPAWAVAFPAITFLVWSGTSTSYSCPMTRLENTIRTRCGWSPIADFVRHYVIDRFRNRT